MGTAQATVTLSWDANTNGAPSDGSGTWHGGTTWWNGTIDKAWADGVDNTNAVVFGATTPGIYSINLDSVVTVTNLTFKTNSYILSGSTLTESGITVANGVSAVINCFLSTPNGGGFVVNTNSTLTLGGGYTSLGGNPGTFGKVDPYLYGVLPVLIVIQNDTGKAISVDHLRAEYVGPNHDRVYATPAKDVRYLRPPQRPNFIDGPAGRGAKVLAKKNPLDAWEIEGRAFTAQMLPAGNTASGFLYFQTGLERGATIYITGLAEAATGKELLFFELPLN